VSACKCDERGHRRRAGSNDVVAVIVSSIAVVAIGACDPVRVHDFDATRFLARSRHVPSVKIGVSPTLTEGWSLYGAPLVATGGKRWQIVRPQNPPKQAETVAVGCHQLPEKFHGKEGVDGSSPSEGLG
jgi:hypothetical protein